MDGPCKTIKCPVCKVGEVIGDFGTGKSGHPFDGQYRPCIGEICKNCGAQFNVLGVKRPGKQFPRR